MCPVGLIAPEHLPAVRGVTLAAARAGISKRARNDVVLMQLAPGSRVSAVFTKNRFQAAPIVVARDHLARAAPRALIINSGNANAGTGQPGEQDARAVCTAVARQLDIRAEEVLPFSTGVIGARLAVDKIEAVLPDCAAGLSPDSWLAAAGAIMTTDIVAKGAWRTMMIDGVEVTVTGIAKGSGMIKPDMATMLAYIATDAPVSGPVLDQCLRTAVERSFNRITVDGDTSTNDACVLVATGQSPLRPIDELASDAGRQLARAVEEVCSELAQAIVRDGEGATKFITLNVRGGAQEADCLAVAFTVAHSPLVKTAFFASDANWGRILAAVGRAPVAALDTSRVGIRMNGARIVTAGAVDPGYREETGAHEMARDEIVVDIDLGMGDAAATVWTTDLSHDYVRINAEYRT